MKIKEYDCITNEQGYILYAMTGNLNTYKRVKPYKASKYGGYYYEPVKADTLRKGLKNGNWIMK